jgi:hypothetical protein
MTDINTFLITKMISLYNASTYGNTSIFTAYYPDLFNNAGNYVLDISGSSRISGDININDGGKLASANPTFQLLNNTVKTIYMGGDASCILLGNTKSTVNTNSNLWVNQVLTASGPLIGLSDSSLNARLYVSKDASFNSNLWTAGTMTASGQLLGLSDASFSTNVWVQGNLQSNSYIKSANYESSDSSNGNIYVGGSDLTGISTRQIYVGNFNSVPKTVNTINVGGVNDNIVVGASNGSLIINTPLKVAASRIYVNCGVSGSITSSATSGLYIGDYQLPSGDFGYINVSNDRNGYVFCPTLAPKNKVKLDVNSLRVLSSTTYPNAGLMTLSRTPAAQIDSSYTIGVGSFDISNVTIRNLSTSTGYQQVIDTSFGILGQTSVGKYKNVITNAQLDISGNVNVSTFLGIGTTSVDPTVNNGWGNTVCALEISGNVYQPPGGYIWQF